MNSNLMVNMQDVIKRYGDFTALDHLNLNIVEGEVLGLLGPNGAGKSTAIKTLCGLIDANGGTVEVFGKPQSVTNLEIRRHIGLVTQEITVFSDLSAIENLRYFGGLYGLKGAELNANVAEMLDFVGLADRAKKRPKTFSGGMQRRLNIACALVHKPKLVIMDEPTVGIDPQSRNHILESTKKLAQKGTTIIYTSHYMEEVQAICSRISIMDAGRVIADGTIDQLMGSITYEDRVNLTAAHASDQLTEELKAIAGVKSVNVSGNQYLIVSGAGSSNVNRIMEVAHRNGGVTSFSEDKPNLEDVFLTLTGKKLRDDEV
ncbi:MAG: ABC transporter ATP-binding protein [Defluviitaleaceae bacterium]|nr:ABC transporter ATP-binding protein [Defluviitaleaceae bacterium]